MLKRKTNNNYYNSVPGAPGGTANTVDTLRGGRKGNPQQKRLWEDCT